MYSPQATSTMCYMGTQLPQKGAQPQQPSISFRSMSIVAKRLDGSECHLVLTTEVGLGSGHIVPSSPPSKGTTAAPNFLAHVSSPNGWTDRDATWYEGIGLGPGYIVLEGNAAPPKGGTAPEFSAYVYCSQTVAHLSYS